MESLRRAMSMSGIGRLLLVVFAVLAALIAGTMGIARASAPENLVESAGFGVCGGRACFLGITPGERRLGDVPRWYFDPGWNQSTVVGGDTTLVTPYAEAFIDTPGYNVNHVRVTMLRVMPPQGGHLPSLGDFMVRYGRPCGRTMVAGASNFRIVYPDMYLSVDSGAQRPGLHTSPAAVVLLDSLQALGVADMCHGRGMYPWTGFSTP